MAVDVSAVPLSASRFNNIGCFYQGNQNFNAYITINSTAQTSNGLLHFILFTIINYVILWCKINNYFMLVSFFLEPGKYWILLMDDYFLVLINSCYEYEVKSTKLNIPRFVQQKQISEGLVRRMASKVWLTLDAALL